MPKYKFVKLWDDSKGVVAVERDLNRLYAEGWELLPVALPNGFGIMQRREEFITAKAA